MRQVDKTASLKNALTAQISFQNDIVYDIWITEDRLLIQSTDMTYGLEYETQDNLQGLDRMASGIIHPMTGKPVIYLYPAEKTDVQVQIDYKGRFTYTYPAYRDGWSVTAYPDGRLINHADGSEHYYLFWEGNAPVDWRFEEGFVVSGEDTERFLRDKLEYMGLTPREYNDFIVYWLPEMQENAYNLITFSTEQYESLAAMSVSPTPDSTLRVHMVYKGIASPISIPEQKLQPFVREGFTVVEWGGSRA